MEDISSVSRVAFGERMQLPKVKVRTQRLSWQMTTAHSNPEKNTQIISYAFWQFNDERSECIQF